MRFTVTKVSDSSFCEEKEFDTIEDLIDWIKTIDANSQQVIVSVNGNTPNLEIYDDYIE